MPAPLNLTPEELAERRRQKQRESDKRYRERNREKLNAKQLEWARKNPDKIRRINSKYIRAVDLGKERTRQRERYEREMSDPVLYAKMRERKARYKRSDRGRDKDREYTRQYRKYRVVRELTTLDRKLLVDPLYAAANKAVPAGIPQFVRDDMIADICVAVLEGDFTIEEIPARAKAIISANFKHFSKFGPVSLDAPRFEDGKRTLHDTVSVGLWDEYPEGEREAQS